MNVLNISCGFMRDDSTVEEKHSRWIPASVKRSREQNYSPLYTSKETTGDEGRKQRKRWGIRIGWVGYEARTTVII